VRVFCGSPNNRWEILGICATLVILAVVVFGQSLNHGFIRLDDAENIYDQPAVTNGLSLEGATWALTHTQVFRWAPLTTLSRQFDCHLYGLNASGHHLTNLFIHTISVLLLFLVLRSMTGMLWRSAFIAGVFAIHPLHVEPEAWLSARGEILAGFFFMLTLAAYLRYVRHPFSWRNYLLILVPLVLGLMSKQTVATLPVVLLLLDYWPLKRLQAYNQLKPLLCEKIPLFAISGLAALAAFTAQQGMIERWGAPLPFLVRTENSLVFYSYYLWKTIAPTDLTFYYTPQQFGFAAWLVGLSITLISTVSALSFLNRQKRPYILTGWLWFVIMLLPLVGIVHDGSGAHPDRYDYLPMIGILFSATWFFSESAMTLRFGREITACVGGGIILILASLSVKQVSYWANDESIWRRFQDCSPVADRGGYKKTGTDLLEKGKIVEAIEQFRLAVANDPTNPETIYLLAQILQVTGSDQEASQLYHNILIQCPSYARAHNNLGDILWRSGNKEEAIKQFKEAFQINPVNPRYALRYAVALSENGNHKDAIELLQKACILNPNNEGLKKTLDKMNALYDSKE
jgi:hypothetical protein